MKKFFTLLFCFCCVSPLWALAPPVVISEVLYDTPLEEDDWRDEGATHNGEFIELFNAKVTAVDLSGWMIANDHESYKLPSGTVIPARGSILIAYRHSLSPGFSLRTLFPSISVTQERQSIIYQARLILRNDGENLVLYDPYHVAVDRMSYTYSFSSDKWPLRAHNGYGNNRRTLSIQRKQIHANPTAICPLASDYTVANATPLAVTAGSELIELDDLYGISEINTQYEVGSIAGEANVTPTGAATYQIPIQVPPGTNGVQPQLSVVYSSQSGGGLLGQGWDIAGLSAITRGTQSLYFDAVNGKIDLPAVQFDDKDRLYLDGQRLILLSGEHFKAGAEYATETENYARIKILGDCDGPAYFQLTTQDGQIMTYGRSGNSHISNAGNNLSDFRILAWKLNHISDVHGNTIEYTYTNNGQYISEIIYAGINKIKFDYTNNTHPKQSYINTFLVKHDKLLSDITVYSENERLLNYHFNYTYSDRDMRLSAVSLRDKDNNQYNPTRIDWGNGGEIKRVDLGKGYDKTLNNSDNSPLYIADVNGDGYGDLIEFWDGREKDTGHFNVYLYDKNTGKFSTTHSCPETVLCKKEDGYVAQIMTGDIDGDGKAEIIANNRGVIEVYQWNGSQLVKTSSIDTKSTYLGKRSYEMFVSDLNHDGYGDIVFLHTAYQQNGRLSIHLPGFYLVYWGNSEGKITKNNLYNSEFLTVDNHQMGDFNADGKPEILALNKGINTNYLSDADILKLLTGNYTPPVYDTCSVITIRKQYKDDIFNIFPADFDGDSRTDLLYQRDNKIYDWEIWSNGLTETKKTDMVHASSPGEDERYGAYVLDYNGDGLPNVIVGDEIFKNKNKDYDKTNWYFYKNTGKGLVLEKSYSNYTRMAKIRGAVADINNDGIADLLMSDGNGDTNYYYFTQPDADKRNLVHGITNGMGQSSKFNYGHYSNYDQTTTTDPIRNLKSPLRVVSSFTDASGAQTNYTYENGKLHKLKGFLGFEKVTAENTRTKQKTVTEYAFDTKFYAVYPKKQTISYNNEIVSVSEQINQVMPWQEKFRYQSQTVLTKNIDYLQDLRKSSSFQYDSSGNLTLQVDTIGVQIKKTEYKNYKKRITTNLAPYLPGQIITTLTRTGQEAITTTTNYTYNEQGAITTQTDYAGTPHATLSEYQYYPQGNIKSVSLTPTGMPKQTTSYQYDSRYRFAEQKTNPLNYTERKIFSPVGNVLSETSFDGLITEYRYNGFGRLLQTSQPNGEVLHHSVFWVLEPQSNYYGFAKQTHSEQITQVSVAYYDRLGREISTEQTGADGITLTSRKEYNALNQVIKGTAPYSPIDPPVYTQYTYDKFGRIEKKYVYDDADLSLTTKYQYSKGTTTVTAPDNQKSISIKDSSGQIAQRTDAGGTINYTYNAAGLLTLLVKLKAYNSKRL